MTVQTDDIELVRGSGNVFADFDTPDGSLRQLRAILAAEVIKTLEKERLTVRDAGERAARDRVRPRMLPLNFPCSRSSPEWDETACGFSRAQRDRAGCPRG